jgi:hypothetical protein
MKKSLLLVSGLTFIALSIGACGSSKAISPNSKMASSSDESWICRDADSAFKLTILKTNAPGIVPYMAMVELGKNKLGLSAQGVKNINNMAFMCQESRGTLSCTEGAEKSSGLTAIQFKKALAGADVSVQFLTVNQSPTGKWTKKTKLSDALTCTVE